MEQNCYRQGHARRQFWSLSNRSHSWKCRGSQSRCWFGEHHLHTEIVFCNWHRSVSAHHSEEKRLFEGLQASEKSMNWRNVTIGADWNFVLKLNSSAMKNKLISVISFFQTSPTFIWKQKPNKQDRPEWNFRKPSGSYSFLCAVLESLSGALLIHPNFWARFIYEK